MAAQKKDKELTGRHVLLMLLAFFGVTIAVNAYFTTMAVTSFRGEDVKRSYRQGLDYNATLEAREQQAALGWSASVNTKAHRDGSRNLLVRIDDASGAALSGLSLSGHLRHPTDTFKDIDVTFEPLGSGIYRAELGDASGYYELKATADNGTSRFHFKHALKLP